MNSWEECAITKKYNWIIGTLIVLLVILVVGFWQQKSIEYKNLENLCQSSASMALENFSNYMANGEDSDYISGVADFRSFMNAYQALNDSSSNTEYIWCNSVYSDMLLHPEKVKSNIQGLIDALKHLAKDYDSPNGFNLINVYSNELTYSDN